MRRFICCVVAALALWPVFTDAQVRIVVRPGGPQPKPAPAAQPAPPPGDLVQPVEPGPEDAARIADLIEQLGAERLAQRDRAMAELAGFEARALGQVRLGKDHQDDEIASRCALLEEVIQSRQAELFLAARRLSLQPSELERLLAAQDVKPLLEILKARAEPGLVPLWARVLGMLAVRSQAIPAAQLCIAVEGREGYGLAAAEAARSALLQPGNAAGLINLLGLLEPARATDLLDALAHCGVVAGGAEGVQSALRTAQVLRGAYPPGQVLDALRAGEDRGARARPEASELRQALALCLTPVCTEAELAAARLPALGAMNPLVLSQYFGLLRRSGLDGRIESALVQLVTLGAPARALGTAGAAWADAVSITRLQQSFAALPGAVQIGALDALWLNPREPQKLQPFLLDLLEHTDLSLRQSAARLLGQFRAPSTVRALADLALRDEAAAPMALEALAPMAELLPTAAPAQMDALAGRLSASSLTLRGPLVDVLVACGHEPVRRVLLENWRGHLPRNELVQACEVLAADVSSPAGAVAGVLLLGLPSRSDRARLGANAEPGVLLLIRALMAAQNKDGFALLNALAADERSPNRGLAAAALALAGQDAARIGEWIRRIAGEAPDASPDELMLAVSLSTQQAAEDFRLRALQQGATSPHLHCVLIAVYAGRSRLISREQMLRGLFDTPSNARQWLGYRGAIDGPIPPEAMRTIVTTLLFSEEFSPLQEPGHALLLAESGVDVLQLLYGDDPAAVPQDAQRATLTALLGDPARAREIMARATVAEDGSNYQALQFARAWLGMLPAAESERMLRMGTDSLTLRVFALRRAAQEGSAPAMRGLMDRFSSRAGQFAEGATAGIELSVDRWRGTSVQLDGVAGDAFGLDGAEAEVAMSRLQRFFVETIPEDWDRWWSARRGLVRRDAETGRFAFLELP